MTGLLETVLQAHGGLERWRKIRTLRVQARIDGELWGRRGQAGVFAEAHIEVDPHVERLVFHGYTAPDLRGVFEPSRVAIETVDGRIVDERRSPAAAFAGQTPTTPWDRLSVVYAAGFDLWTYFASPFLLGLPGVRVEELEPWEEAGEQWRRLKALFPDSVLAHGKEQTYAFNSAGLQRRFEYQPKLGGVPTNVNYAAEHRSFGGISIATRRRMFPLDAEGRTRPEPVLMSVDVVDVRVENR